MCVHLLLTFSGETGTSRGHPADACHLYQGGQHLHHGLHQDEPERAGLMGPSMYRPLLHHTARLHQHPFHILIFMFIISLQNFFKKLTAIEQMVLSKAKKELPDCQSSNVTTAPPENRLTNEYYSKFFVTKIRNILQADTNGKY